MCWVLSVSTDEILILEVINHLIKIKMHVVYHLMEWSKRDYCIKKYRVTPDYAYSYLLFAKLFNLNTPRLQIKMNQFFDVYIYFHYASYWILSKAE